jgi:DNA primase
LQTLFASAPSSFGRRPAGGVPPSGFRLGLDRAEVFGERGRGHGANRRGQTVAYAAPGRYVAASPQLATSPVHRGHFTAVPRREALILLAVFNHPWLLHDHLEDLCGIEFRHDDTRRLKQAVIDVFADDSAIDAEALRAELGRRGLAGLVQRVERAITTGSVWGAKAEAAPDDVVPTWKQLLALHRQWHSLTKELKDAERALGQESTDANYSWLRDVKARLSDVEGTEALIEGFGVSSGRARAG